jgi:hypothetical protein
VHVEDFATGWSLVQRSPTKCFHKITKPPAWGGQGPYKNCRATDKDDGDGEEQAKKNVIGLYSKKKSSDTHLELSRTSNQT